MRTIGRVANLKERILHDIRSGALRSGEKIASRHQFMMRYHCARGSIDRAIKKLTDDGFLYSRQGAGTFVAERNENGRKIKRVYIVGQFERSYLNRASFEPGSVASGIQSYLDCMLCRVEDAAMNLNTMARNGSAVIWDRPDYQQLLLMEFLRKANVPQLLLHRSFGDYESISTDSRTGINEGLEWLIEHAGSEIAYISTRNSLKYPYVMERKMNFFELAIHNSATIPPDQLFVDWEREPELSINMVAVAETIFKNSRSCRAIYLDYAPWCGAFLREAARLERLPGRDFWLLVFDSDASGFQQPGVTMIQQDHEILKSKIIDWTLGKTVAPLNFKIKPKLIKNEDEK